MTALLKTPALVLALAALAGPAAAAESDLPLDLTWCEARESVEAKLTDPSELTGGVVESQATVFGLRGTVTAIFEDAVLLTLRFRVFETEKAFTTIKADLMRSHGEGVLKDRTKEGMARNLSLKWEIDADRALQLKVSSEQIYVNWEVAPSYCLQEEAARVGLSDTEKADIEATKKRDAIHFDPMEEDIEDVNDRKKTADDAKKSEAQVEEEKEKEKKPDPKDVDVDW